jgi:predicted flap endonuclease-1-like 5' DNA nuclease
VIKKDDFRIIKGIGPKISAALHKAGIVTFEQIGLMNTEKLQQVLESLDLPSTKASFWQKQAVLAAAEDWEQLEELQNAN